MSAMAVLATSTLILRFGTIYCMQVVPELAKVTYVNEKYVTAATFNVRRYGRKSDYYINWEGILLQTWGNNVTIDIILTEYLHNEYRRSFIEFHYKLCDLINNEPYIGMMIKKTGVICPAPKGQHVLHNMTVQTQSFPNVFPFQRGGADIELKVTETREVMMTMVIHLKFIQKLKKN